MQHFQVYCRPPWSPVNTWTEHDVDLSSAQTQGGENFLTGGPQWVQECERGAGAAADGCSDLETHLIGGEFDFSVS